MKTITYLFKNLIVSLFSSNWRLSPQWTLAKKLAKQKYGNKCDKCGSRKSIEVHHLESAKDNKLLRFEISNLRLLCKRCHRTGPKNFHNYFMGGTKVRCTKKDYYRWKRNT